MAALVINGLVTAIAVANTVHHRFFGDVVSIAEFSHAWQLLSVIESILAALRPKDALYLLDIALGLIVLPIMRKLSRQNPSRHERYGHRFAAGLMVSGVLLAAPSVLFFWKDPEQIFEFAVGRRQIVAALGILPYHLYDAGNYLAYSVFERRKIGEPERQRVRQFVEERRRQDKSPSKFQGVTRGRNLIMIQAEALHAFPIGLRFLGQEITPRLTAFAKESLCFVNFYDQTYGGATSDGEFTSLHSLHPLAEGAVATRYQTNRFYVLPTILTTAGYHTFAAIGASGESWNMRQMHSRLGFQWSYFDSSYKTAERFGQGVADSDFFKQTLPFLQAATEPYLAFLVSVSNHHPYKLPKRHRVLRLGELERTMLGDYLESVHYFDRAFGEFIDGLRATGALERAVVVVYGDHQAWLGEPPELARLLGFSELDRYRYWEVRKKLALLIRLPRGQHAGPRRVAGGHLDIAPTVLSLLGIEAADRVMFGTDLTKGTSTLVVFRDGSFSDGRHHHINRDHPTLSSACYEVGSGERINCAPLQEKRQEALERLEMSDLILKGDLLPMLTKANLPINLSLLDLAPPKSYSKQLGLTHVKIQPEGCMFAHPPSGARFSVATQGWPAKLFFTPGFTSDVPRDGKTDGVTFEVRRNDEIVYQKHILPTERQNPVVIDIAKKGDSTPVAITFVTLPGPRNDLGYDWAMWQKVRIQLNPEGTTSPSAKFTFTDPLGRQ